VARGSDVDPEDARCATITFLTGVIQGGASSPRIFVVFINALLEAKNRMAEGRQFGRSLGAVGGSGRGGYPGRGEGGMEGGYGEGGRLGERGGFMRPPGGGSRGLSSGAQIQSGREGFGRGAGRGGGPRGAGSSQSAGRLMWDPMRMAASLVGKYLTAVSAEARQAAEGAEEDGTSRAEALLQRMTQVAAEENQALGGKERILTKALEKGGDDEEWVPREGRPWPTTEATKRDNMLKEQEGMSQMVTVTLRNLGVGQGGVDGIFPQHTPEQARKVLEGWFRKKSEGAFSVSMLFRPSMSGPNKNLVLGATWNAKAEMELQASEDLRNGGRAVYMSRVIGEDGKVKEGGEEWRFKEYSGNLLLSFKKYFGKDAEVDVPMNTEAEEAVIITAGQDVGELGAWAKVMSAAVGPGKVAEMLRVACAEAGLPAESVDTPCSVTPANMERIERLMAEQLRGEGDASLGNYPDLTDGRPHLNSVPHSVASKYMLRLQEGNSGAKWVYKIPTIDIEIRVGGVELKMPAYLSVFHKRVSTELTSDRKERTRYDKGEKREVGLLTVDLRGGGGGGNSEMRATIVGDMVQRNELPSSEAYLGSSGAQTVLRGYINEAIAGYIKVAKPLDADISGTPKVLHSGLETGPNGKKVSILYLVLSNVGQAKAVGSWMNLLDTGTPALNIWPPGVREVQTSETALKVFKAHWDKKTGEVDFGVRELVSLSERPGNVLEGWKSASTGVQAAIARSLQGEEGAEFMMMGGKDMRGFMTPEERDRFVKGMARIAQSNSIKMIEGMSEQVGKELREELKRQKAATRMQQEQIMTQQGQIQQLTELVNSLHGGVPPLLEAMTGAKEKGGEGGRRGDGAKKAKKRADGLGGGEEGGTEGGKMEVDDAGGSQSE
jgi:hypothetical protein